MTYTPQHKAEILQDRFGHRVVARLSAANQDLPYDISERLRAARTQALARRKVAETRTAPAGVVLGRGGAAVLGFGSEGGWWSRMASMVPVVALVVGMVAVKMIQDDNRASELAEVDVAILTDNLPPQAYTDPGFLQFLRAGGAAGEPAAATQE